MATQNASDQNYANNSDGWQLAGGTTARQLTVTGANITLTGAGTNVYTFPAATDTLAGLTAIQTLTSKTLTGPVIDQFGTASGVGAAWSSWTPTFTNLTVSSSTVTAAFIQLGKTVFYRLAVVLAGGNAPSGAVSFTLPVTSASYAGTSTLPIIGTSQYFITLGYLGVVVWVDTTHANFIVTNAASTYAIANNISATVPSTFTNGSELHAEGFYQAA